MRKPQVCFLALPKNVAKYEHLIKDIFCPFLGHSREFVGYSVLFLDFDEMLWYERNTSGLSLCITAIMKA